MSVSEVPVLLTAFGAEPRPGTAFVVEQRLEQRVARALAALGALWGLALLALFIPVAHFVLVPAFALAGLLLALKRLREDRRLLGVHGPCARCGLEQDFKGGGRFAPGRTLDCPKCHTHLALQQEAARG